ncbi:MAG: DUF2254 family protein, partial [Flavisolibacter sp.]
NTPLLKITSKNGLSENFEEKLRMLINIGRGQEIVKSYYYGLRHLMEIAIKALSPGINDPGTATISLQAIGDLLAYRMNHFPVIGYTDKDETVRIVVKEKGFEDMFDEYVLPIWDYGKEDRLIQKEMLHILLLLDKIGKKPAINKLLQEVHMAVKKDPSKAQ